MFDKKEMKLINFEKAKKYLMNGVQVYMVNLDGSLVEINEDTDWKKILFHNLKGGSYAIYKKKFTGIGTFTIMEVKNGWGRLKSGAGWIWLENPSYCTVGKTVASSNKTSGTKTVDELAKEVIKGLWGNGANRKAKLTAAGYDYAKVQKRVNELLK